MTKMVNVLSFTVVLLCFLQPCYCLETLPVLVVDTGGISVMGANVGNPFNKISHEVFSEMVEAIIAKASLTLIFLENELSIEHISKKDSQGSSYKAFLQDMITEKKLIYLPSVINPFNTLTSLLPMTSDNTHDLATAKQLAKEFKPSTHVYIKFEPDEPTVERLRLHDLAMRTIIRAAKSTINGSLVAFYTGINNPLVMEKKLSPKVKKVDDKSVVVASKRVLFRLTVEFEHKGVRDLKPVEVPVVKHEHEELSRQAGGDDLLSTTLAFSAGFYLRFNFLLRSKDWILDKITLLESDVEVGQAHVGIGAPLRSSYHCAETLRIVNSRDQSAVILRRYQWQPSRESCELTKKGCDDNSARRARFKLPVGTVKDMRNVKNPLYSKLHVDEEYLDEKDTWGNKKKSDHKLYDYEALFEADADHKGHEGTEKSSLVENKKKKKPGYIIEDKDEDIIENENKDGENKDPSGQKKHSADKHVDANDVTLDSQGGGHKPNTTQEKDPLTHNKQYPGGENDTLGQNTNQNETGKVLFDQKKHPNATDEKHKTKKQKGKDHLNNKKQSKNESKDFEHGKGDKEDQKSIKPDQHHAGNDDKHKGYPDDTNRDTTETKKKDKTESSATNVVPPANVTVTVPPVTGELAFGTSVNCGPFFNHEVLSCLLVTFIILGMFFYGLGMMVNLKANDRFDDFGGRTFAIAEEK